MGLYGQQNTFQLEELASQGYVVIALNFTGYAATTIFLTETVWTLYQLNIHLRL